ncbi:glycogen synthase [Kordia sp. SMS9]|uniref:glycosyltransferase family 4 protein n=1 Tax=Kordia sp. SMS9 TaxID=2282170 RepID=UPI000E0DCFC7|nr:glycosyltransferase family 4 protein [Kordia sp. SMS9]AXG71345.1 glycogen synthase [Kordia sp. SMS9]
MHIGFLLPEYPHENVATTGGIGTSIRNVALSLTSNGHKVSVFIYSQNENKIFYDGTIKVHKIKQQVSKMYLTWYTNRKYIQNYVQNYVSEDQIDVLEAPDWTGITAFMKFSIPLVIRLNGSDTYFCHLDGRKVKSKNAYFEGKALRSADKIISASDFTAQKTKELFKLNNTIDTVHNGIFTNYFLPLPAANVKENNVLYFGTIIRKKGVLELASAFNKVIESNPEATLTLLGKDTVDIFDNVSTLQLFYNLLSKEAKKQVTHIQQVPHAEVKTYLAAAAVIVLPSFAEALPMTWIEAMASAKPLITSDVGWAKEVMIHNETGYTVNPKNHELFAEYMIELLQDKNKREKFGAYAREVALKNFDIMGSILQKNIKAYKAVMLKK